MQNGRSDETRLDRLLNLAVRIGRVVDALPDSRLGRHIAGQIVKCGTSGPPNYNEGRAAESRDDFVHKLAIVLKELRETEVWLRLVVKAEMIPEQRLAEVIDETDQLSRIIAQSIVTAKRNRGPKGKELVALFSFAFFIACFAFFIL